MKQTVNANRRHSCDVLLINPPAAAALRCRSGVGRGAGRREGGSEEDLLQRRRVTFRKEDEEAEGTDRGR